MSENFIGSEHAVYDQKYLPDAIKYDKLFTSQITDLAVPLHTKSILEFPNG